MTIDFTKVRRVRVDTEPTPQQLRTEREQREALAATLAHQRLTEADDAAS